MMDSNNFLGNAGVGEREARAQSRRRPCASPLSSLHIARSPQARHDALPTALRLVLLLRH